MPNRLQDELDKVKLSFYKTCETLVRQGRLAETEFQEIRELFESMGAQDEQEFVAELGRISKGLSDFLE